MLLISENRILTINDKAIEKKINMLTFNVEGAQFPTTTNGLVGNFKLSFYKAQSVTLNFGDGAIKTFNTIFDGIQHNIEFKTDGSGIHASHTYLDGNSGNRVVVFNIQELEQLKAFASVFCSINGVFPQEIGAAKRLEILSIRGGRLTSFPTSIAQLGGIKSWQVDSALVTYLPQISDAIFANPIEALVMSACYNLADVISSNFFKIDQLKHTITSFQNDRCNVVSFPDEIEQCQKLTIIRSDFNAFTALPLQVEKLPLLITLTLGSLPAQRTLLDSRMLNFENSKNLKNLTLRFDNIDLTDLDVKWSGLYSLTAILLFKDFINTSQRFDEFIDKFYLLCTNNGSKITNGSAAPYPNRFRNISWGDGTLSFTGAKVAPAGYVQGVSNGTPINQGQKAYVLQNQYNHTITHA